MIGVDSDDKVLSWIQERADKDTDPEFYFLVTRYQMHKCSGYCLRSKKIEMASTPGGVSSTSPEK